MSRISLLFVPLAAYVLVGCSQGLNSGNLSGTTWSQDCAASADNITIEGATFTDTTMTYTVSRFDNLAGANTFGCSAFDVTLSYVYNYTLGDKLTSGSTILDDFDDLSATDFTLSAINVTPLNAIAATALNGASYCGKTTWASGTATDLLTLSTTTLINCRGGVVGGMTFPTGVGRQTAYPFNVEQYDATGAQVVTSSGLQIFGSTALIIFDAIDQLLVFGRGSITLTDGKSSARRAIVGISGSTNTLMRQ